MSIEYLESAENKGRMEKPKHDLKSDISANKRTFDGNNNDELHQ